LKIFRRFRSRRTARVAAASAVVASSIAPSSIVSLAAATRPGEAVVRSQAPVISFDIPSLPLAEALELFASTAGVRVDVVAGTIEGLQSPGVTGRMTAEEALRALLRDTPLTVRASGPSAFAVDFALTEFVAVAGEFPRSASPKLPGLLRDQPQTITVIPSAVIAAQGATTLRDVLRNVPGITYQAGEGGGGLPGDKLTMRGFSADGDIFIDGIRDVGAYTRDAFNLEQVEVVKGPASAIGGRGSTGGAINLSTKTAHQSLSRSASFGVGSAAYQRGTLDVNQPIAGLEGASLRLNAMWTDTGYAGRDIVENESWGVAPSLAVGLGKRVRATLNFQHLEQNNVPDYGLSWAAFNATPAVDQANFYGLENYDYEDISNDVATLTIEGEVAPGFTLRNSTRVGATVRDSAITAPRPPNRQLQQRYFATESRANATNLRGALQTGALRHEVTAGAEFAQEGVLTYNQAQSTNQPQTALERPNPADRPLAAMPRNLGTVINDARINTIGVYAFDTVDVHPRVQVNAGLRWDRSNVDYAGTTRATGARLALSRADRMLSWRAGVVVRPRPNGTIYAGYSTAFNPSADGGNAGTALSDSPISANNINLDPEKSRNVELGTRWDVAGSRLSLSAAWFRTEKDNARTRNATNEPFVLDGRQRVSGVELGASGSIAPAWSILANVALMGSEIVASQNPAERGQDFALTPRASATLWTTFTLPFHLMVGGGLQYQDAMFRNTINTLTLPSYWLLNATAAYPLNSNLTLRMNGDNLTDKAYVDRVGGGHYIPGPRRTVKLSVDVTF
jgi:catecholate siderophore receptor